MTALGRHLAALPPADFIRGLRPLSPDRKRGAMRARWRYDVGGMLKYCFPTLYSRRWNRFHRDVLGREKVPYSERKGSHFNLLRADAAPRGNAKTTLLKGDLLHDVVYDLEEFIVVVSAETRLARSITRDLFRKFSARSGRFVELYGPFKVEGGVDSFSVTMPNGHRTAFLARSFGTQIRGANDDGPRPTKIVVDDGERPDRVRNPKTRNEWMEFLEDDIINAGPADGGLVLEWRGTVLHPDAILARLFKREGWQTSKYRAMEGTPKRADLWEECRRIFIDLERGDLRARYDAARAFHELHKAEMCEGVTMLDEEAYPLFALYLEVWTKGWRSVNRDRQNEPRDSESSLFNLDRPEEPGCIRRCRFDGRYIHTSRGTVVPIAACKVAIWLDHSGGKAKSDYPAIAVVAKDPDGWRYWIRCDLTRRQPSAQHAALWTVWEHFAALNPSVGVDATGTQGLLGEAMDRQTKDRRAAGKPWNMDLREYTYSKRGGSAATLIEEWESVLSGGFLEVAEDLPDQVLSQIRDFPGAAHDDALAAAERADWLLMGAPEVAPTVRDAVRTLGWLSGGR